MAEYNIDSNSKWSRERSNLLGAAQFAYKPRINYQTASIERIIKEQYLSTI